jgi:hypothetical protein
MDGGSISTTAVFTVNQLCFPLRLSTAVQASALVIISDHLMVKNCGHTHSIIWYHPGGALKLVDGERKCPSWGVSYDVEIFDVFVGASVNTVGGIIWYWDMFAWFRGTCTVIRVGYHLILTIITAYIRRTWGVSLNTDIWWTQVPLHVCPFKPIPWVVTVDTMGSNIQFYYG